jgi:uncharacterized membrane protein
MTLESSKNLGGIGALLIVIAGLGIFGSPYVGALGLVGLILVMIALKGFADVYSEGSIFNNALYALIIAIVGGVVTIGAAFAAIMFWVSGLPIDITNPDSIAQFLQGGFMDMDALFSLLGALVIVLVLLFLFTVLTAFFFRKSLNTLSTKAGVSMFGTAGILMLIGALLTIILVGFVLIWIGFILLIVAFFSVRAQAAPPPSQPPA